MYQKYAQLSDNHHIRSKHEPFFLLISVKLYLYFDFGVKYGRFLRDFERFISELVTFCGGKEGGKDRRKEEARSSRCIRHSSSVFHHIPQPDAGAIRDKHIMLPVANSGCQVSFFRCVNVWGNT